MERSEEEWLKILGPERYEICRAGGTEPPFTGCYWDCKEEGTYRCAGCNTPLFRSAEKYDSGSGWPSFWACVNEKCVVTREDHSLGRMRLEILCANCHCHLGHVFPDGPQPSGLRYCVNSASLNLDIGDPEPPCD